MVMVMVMVGVLSENRHKKLSCDRTLNILAYYLSVSYRILVGYSTVPVG
jgi:hypothetical protein